MPSPKKQWLVHDHTSLNKTGRALLTQHTCPEFAELLVKAEDAIVQLKMLSSAIAPPALPVAVLLMKLLLEISVTPIIVCKLNPPPDEAVLYLQVALHPGHHRHTKSHNCGCWCAMLCISLLTTVERKRKTN